MTAEEEYAQLMGEEALERQRRETGERYPCCWERRGEPHLGDCPGWEPPPPPEGQEALL